MWKRISWSSVAAWALGAFLAEAYLAYRSERAAERDAVGAAEWLADAAARGDRTPAPQAPRSAAGAEGSDAG